MKMSATDQRVTLARRIFDRTGSREAVVSGMRNLGYGKAEAEAAADSVAPAPAKATPSPAPASKPDDKTTGAPTAQSPDPTASSSNGGGSGSWFTAGSSGLPSPTLSLPRRPTAENVAGFGLGALVYVLALQYLRYGAGGPTGWLKAKFFNKPYSPPANALDQGEDGTDSGADATPQADTDPLLSTRPLVAAPPGGTPS